MPVNKKTTTTENKKNINFAQGDLGAENQSFIMAIDHWKWPCRAVACPMFVWWCRKRKEDNTTTQLITHYCVEPRFQCVCSHQNIRVQCNWCINNDVKMKWVPVINIFEQWELTIISLLHFIYTHIYVRQQQWILSRARSLVGTATTVVAGVVIVTRTQHNRFVRSQQKLRTVSAAGPYERANIICCNEWWLLSCVFALEINNTIEDIVRYSSHIAPIRVCVWFIYTRRFMCEWAICIPYDYQCTNNVWLRKVFLSVVCFRLTFCSYSNNSAVPADFGKIHTIGIFQASPRGTRIEIKNSQFFWVYNLTMWSATMLGVCMLVANHPMNISYVFIHILCLFYV